MPVIKPRTRGKEFVRLVTRVEQENHETLYAYARFISEPPDYVLNELIDTVLAGDPDYCAWRTEHPESHVPPRQARPIRRRRRGDARAKGRVAPSATDDRDAASPKP